MSEVAEAAAVAQAAAPVVAAEPVATPAPAEGGETAQNKAESATPKAPTDEKPETHGKHRVERKISRLYREAAEARAERDLLRRQLEEARPKAPDQTGKPTLEQFNFDPEQYAQAIEKYARDQAIKERESREREQHQQREQARLTESWEEKYARADDKYPDFDEVVGKLTPTTPWAIAVMEVDNGDDVAYHLGKNLKEARRIAGLTPIRQAIEIGRLSAKLSSEPQKPKMPSAAPPPITPLSGAAPVITDQPSENDDMKTWIRKRSKVVHGR